jgi:hypothetical protein
MDERCRREHDVKLSAVFITVRFLLFSAFSAKKWSQTSRFRQKCEVNPIVVGEMRSKTVRFRVSAVAYSEKKQNMRFRQIHGVKCSLFAKKH